MFFGVLTVSDRCSEGICEDLSGKEIAEMLKSLGTTKIYRIVPDDKERISNELIYMCDTVKADVIFTTGGTGFSPRDVTPEATRAVCERDVPGIPEAIRAESFKITPKAMLSRATAGIRGKSLIINLPGSPKAVRESLGIVIPVLPHAVEIMSGKKISCGKS